MSIKTTGTLRGFDSLFQPGAARPAGSMKGGGRLVLADDTVLLRSDLRDKMVTNPEQGYSRSDIAHEKASREASRAYESTFKSVHSSDELFKLARPEQQKVTAQLQVGVDRARRELGTYKANAASDYKLEPGERDKMAKLEKQLDAQTKALAEAGLRIPD